MDKIKELIDQAQEDGLLISTLYGYKDGANWIKIKQAANTLSKIKAILNEEKKSK